MTEPFSNVYEDEQRADAYAGLEFPGTYWLAYRDLPAIIARHARGRTALDFGCGTGRSTRFLRDLDFDPIGVDISESMLTRARELDPAGEYRVVPDGEVPGFEEGSFDLILSVFTFDNIPTLERKVALHGALGRLLAEDGRMVSLVSSPDIYVNEWVSFSTKDFPENPSAGTGDAVQIIMLDVEDRRPVQDVVCTDETYRDVFERADLVPIELHRPLGKPDEPFDWVSEERISPWSIYVLGRNPWDGAR